MPVTGPASLPTEDLSIGAKVLIGDHNWRRGPFWQSVWAFLFGKRERITHLGFLATIAWWQERPYLVCLREVRK